MVCVALRVCVIVCDCVDIILVVWDSVTEGVRDSEAVCDCEADWLAD
jgi:hypothetical protein